ncbi:hypothetical protein ACJDT4_18000 [Clostridium neuense]|uniref:Glucose/Sorbosone dehydrogenase domain-containing protein n=1 Tax=Clostridium neuense TaxID=1728934 RepID=A0ABW8TJA2_9CLOT
MKKIIKTVCVISLISLLSYFIVNRLYATYDVKCTDKNMNYSIKYKGLNKAVDFDKGEDGTFYIAYNNKVQAIYSNGKSIDIIKDDAKGIMSILYYRGKLYMAKEHGIYYYDFQSKELKALITNIPNFGDYKKIIMKAYKDYIYASIGSATNSGVVGSDNKWTSINPYGFDITPNSITLKGINFGKDKTGAFVPYKTSNIRGQIIPNHFPGNSSVIIVNLNTKAAETYAWGIRNICGMDFTSGGKIIASVGGMENRGLRPIKGDVDYIYSIEKGKWYGWPDYSGGDPVDSPKFKNKTKRILDKVPNINPPAPLYEYDNVGSLDSISIDSNGILGLKDLMYVYDKKNNNIICINGNKMNKYIMFTRKSYVEDFRIYKDGIYVLDSKEGCLLRFYQHHENALLIVDKKILYCIAAAIGISALIILIYGMRKN